MRTSRAPWGFRPPGREWKPTGLPRLLIFPSKMWLTLTGGDVRLHSSAVRSLGRDVRDDREDASPQARSTTTRVRATVVQRSLEDRIISSDSPSETISETRR